MKPLNAATVQSVIRHVISILALLGAIKANDNQIEGWIPSITVVVMLAVNFFWARSNDKSLVKADPGSLSALLLCGMLIGASVGLGGCISKAKDLPNKGVAGPLIEQDARESKIGNASAIQFATSSPADRPVTETIETLAVGEDGKVLRDEQGHPIIMRSDRVVKDKDGNPVVPNENIIGSATGPSGYGLTTAESARWVAYNHVMRIASIVRRPDGTFIANTASGTDFRASLKGSGLSFDIKTWTLKAESIEASFETLSSTVFDMSNQSLKAWADVAKLMTEEQRTSIVAKLEAEREVAIKALGIADSAVQQLTKIISIFKNPAAVLVP